MPWGGASTHAVANGANVYVFNITNDYSHSVNELLILQNGITIGTIYRRQTKTFNVPKGATIVVKNQSGTAIVGATYSNVAGGQTVTW